MWLTRKCSGSKTKVLKSISRYLDGEEHFELDDECYVPSGSRDRGRPRKSFQESSVRTKKRRPAELRTIEESMSDSLRDNSISSATQTFQ